jgi:hypothetical protein
MLPDLRGKHAEEMQRIGMIGLQRQRLAIERFGLRKPAGLVMGKARCKRPAMRGSDAGAPPRLAAASLARRSLRFMCWSRSSRATIH